MPALGLGTFGSDHASPASIAQAVRGALEVGYRHIDCAAVYGNEREIGQELARAMEGGLPREELWITSKLWNDRHEPEQALEACRQSIRDLQVGYLDLYLIHWPFPNAHAPGVDVTSRAADARPYIHADYMRTWRTLEALVEEGLVRQIGTSNMTRPKLELLLRDARIRPAVNEMELHPYLQQPAMVDYLQREGIVPVAFAPLGSPDRPARDRMPDDPAALQDPTVCRIAAQRGWHPALVCLRWALQRDTVPIPMSTRRQNYLANLRVTLEAPLSAEEMAALAAVDRHHRLIKGQVFLWRPGQSWEDLWDEDGLIAR
ncbi:MAG: aldo/keto reductase [Chloroflexi bacterium]|nr:aldo/keto reductase [Chloroflexota bacterium]